ncbi:MAG: tRNA (N6-isopentenyl adenosine(37)-C2)-methylthiotransferase MiaB [Coriobacteriales bacterium]|nr:tRNA (N6-isopentenyl adenosine(37)-C2)-methylthiotransferase MiaB [Coriobacteriales bacterium]
MDRLIDSHPNQDMRLDGLSYLVRSFGCQMNRHDSERVAGMLDVLGATPVEAVEDADIVVYMTCCVREAADIRAYGQIASLKNMPSPHGRRYVCMGGCIAQRDREGLFKELPNLDVVFGTHNIHAFPALLAHAMETDASQIEILEASTSFSSDLPSHREMDWHAWVPISIGCTNFCTYCVVPYVRGREKSRPFEDIMRELVQLERQGVKEVTFLGQNVNSYGRDLYGKPRFADILKAAGDFDIPRIRFATSHPKDLSHETIQAMASVESVMPQLHLAVQSGSNRILKAMNRPYTIEHYLGLIDEVRQVVGDIALSTDIIVGFPGETQDDFEQTMELCRKVGYSQAFTFIYSRRQGTPAASMPDDTPREVIQERFDRLVELIQETAHAANQAEKGTVQRILVDGPSRRDPNIIAGRSPKNQMVHAPLPEGWCMESLKGSFLDIQIDEARTWYLQGRVIDAI